VAGADTFRTVSIRIGAVRNAARPSEIFEKLRDPLDGVGFCRLEPPVGLVERELRPTLAAARQRACVVDNDREPMQVLEYLSVMAII
jgi:hypothetical protein